LLHLVENEHVNRAALPLVVGDYLDATDAVPDWADQRLIRRGQDFFAANGLEFLLVFGFGTLPVTYCSTPGANVIHAGSRLESDTRRRLFETLQMVIEVMSPGGLQPGGRAVHVGQKVRLMHAAIRRLLLRSPRYDESWGLPVNQEDMAGTLTAIVWAPLTRLPRMGCAVTSADAEAVLHTWRVAGHLLGLRDELFPRDMDDVGGLVEALARRQFARCDAGVALTADLIAAYGEIVPPAPFGRRLAPMLIREFIGDEWADLLAVPPTNWTRFIYRAASAATWRDRRIGPARVSISVHAWLGRRLVAGFLAAERGGRRPSFSIPDHLQGAWGLRAPQVEPTA
jgi:hypothetical protein